MRSFNGVYGIRHRSSNLNTESIDLVPRLSACFTFETNEQISILKWYRGSAMKVTGHI